MHFKIFAYEKKRSSYGPKLSVSFGFLKSLRIHFNTLWNKIIRIDTCYKNQFIYNFLEGNFVTCFFFLSLLNLKQFTALGHSEIHCLSLELFAIEAVYLDCNTFKKAQEKICSSYIKYCPSTRISISLFLQMTTIVFNSNRKR